MRRFRGGGQGLRPGSGPAYLPPSQPLEAECAKVRDAFASTPGYGGVTAEHLLSWTALIG